MLQGKMECVNVKVILILKINYFLAFFCVGGKKIVSLVKIGYSRFDIPVSAVCSLLFFPVIFPFSDLTDFVKDIFPSDLPDFLSSRLRRANEK